MPTRAMEQRRPMPPFHLPEESESSFSPELRLRAERPAELLKQEAFPEHVEIFSLISRSNPVAEKLNPVGAKVVDRFERMDPYKLMDQNNPFGLEHKLFGQQRHANLPRIPLRGDQDSLPNISRIESFSGTNYENGLFSSSLPDIFDNKLRLTSKGDHSGQPVVNLNHVGDEPFELSEEIGAQIIGDLLPDDDDLLSGVLDDVGNRARANNRDDIDDDIFYSGGGMELEADESNKLLERKGGADGLNGLLNGENPYKKHPSRILFVRNINSHVEDSELKLLFEQYGDIRTLYTACKHRGFVIVSYYDIRSAECAIQELQSKPFRRWKLDIHYYIPKDNPLEKDIHNGSLVVPNLDPSVSNDDLRHMFGGYGEIKEIHETSQNGQKSIEFYDIRAAETALYALNRSEEMKIKLGPSCLGGNRRLMQVRPVLLEQEGFGSYKLGNPNSLPSSCFGSVNVASIRSTGPEHGISRVLRSRVQTPVNHLREGTFLDAPSTTTQSISSPVGIASARTHNQSGLGEHSNSLGRMTGQINGHLNYGFQGSGAFHPHSLPEFQNAQNNGIPYNLSTIPPIGVKSNSRTTEGLDARHLYKGGSSDLGGHTEALGSSRTGSCPLHGQQLSWYNSNNSHHQPTSAMLWPNTGPFISNTPSRPLNQVHGMSRASRMLENALPMNHHIGSAPALNTSIWDRRHGHAGEMVEAPGFNPGSVGSLGFPGSPHLHQLEVNSMFPQTRGSCMEPAMSPVHIGGPSPQQRGHTLHGRSHMTPLPCSFDSPGERMRSRRNESSANQSDNRKQYELDIERILRGEDSRTTLMIKNIPNKYTSKMLLAAIDESHRGTYDFIYLPIDFKNKCNVGYAFINMISPENIIPFYKVFHGKRWEKFNSEKVASLAYARIQGKSALIAHFQNSSLMNEDKRCRPILFHSDGPNAGDQEPFPMGTNIRSRSGRSRILSCGENYHDTLSTSANGGSQTSGYAKETDVTSA